jgi:hypothetical protein
MTGAAEPGLNILDAQGLPGEVAGFCIISFFSIHNAD